MSLRPKNLQSGPWPVPMLKSGLSQVPNKDSGSCSTVMKKSKEQGWTSCPWWA